MNPLLYQINARPHLSAISPSATLDDLTEAELDRYAELGFDWLYLLGVWKTGPVSQKVAQSHRGDQEAYRRLLPDLRSEDVCGSCFAIAEYAVTPRLGGDASMTRLRERLHQRGLKLMLDFVPNHTGLDHAWVKQHPEFYIHASSADYKRAPQNFYRIPGSKTTLAHGRDPFFDGWTDTLQLNYANLYLQDAMTREMLRIAKFCDGLRCDMAMLILPDVYLNTWGLQIEPFWPAAIQHVRAANPDFTFMAEVYWDRETELLEQGFDTCYDKRLYDALVAQDGRAVATHIRKNLAYLPRLAHFIENHDEQRAASAFPPEVHPAAALITYTLPGLRFFHEGQLEGWMQKIPVQLCRAPIQPLDPNVSTFYLGLLELLKMPALKWGSWHLIDHASAAPIDRSDANILPYAWEHPSGDRVDIAINFSPEPVTVRLPSQQSSEFSIPFELPAWGFRVMISSLKP